MLQNLTKHIPLTTIILSYFFVCGGLYLIGFWSKFNIDIYNLVSLSDIPKSFILPFVISQGFYVFNSLTGLLTSATFKDTETTPKTRISRSWWRQIIRNLLSLDFLILISTFIALKFYFVYKMEPVFWVISAFTFSFLISTKFDSMPTIKKAIPYFHLRMYIVNTIIAVPLISYAIGKVNSLTIYNNDDKRYISIISDTTHSENTDKNLLKFVGFLGDKLIVSSVDKK